MDTPTPRKGQAGRTVVARKGQRDYLVVHDKTLSDEGTKGAIVAVRAKTETRKVSSVRTPTKVVPRRHAPAQSRMGLRTPADDPLSLDRVTYLLKAFTSKRLAGWLGVSPSQTSRWSKGKERPGPAVAPALIDLEHVYARARLVWGEEAARIWLESPNSYLDGARPFDVLYTDGPSRVLQSLDAEMWGGAS